MKRFRFVLPVVLLFILVGCVPLYDHNRVMGLKELKLYPGPDAPQVPEKTSCYLLLERENELCTTKSPSCDKKSLRHVQELCNCYDQAVGDIQISACRANLDAYIVYEENKRGGTH